MNKTVVSYLVLALMISVAGVATLILTLKPPNVCGETQATAQEKFYNPFTPDNSGLKNKTIRTLTMGRDGLWIGYAGGAGVSFFDGVSWRFCRETPHVNAIAIDEGDHPWIGTDAPSPQNSLLHYDGSRWEDLSTKLPDRRVYGLAFYDHSLYVATWEGVAKFSAGEWSVPFDVKKNIFNNHVHSIAFTPQGDIWFGSIDRGVTWYFKENEPFPWIPVSTPSLNQTSAVRKIIVAPGGKQVLVATDGAGVAMYSYATNSWTQFPVPNEHVLDLKFDHYVRLWIATSGGVFYLEGGKWTLMDEDPALSLAFGCEGCVFGPDVLFIGTDGLGLIQFHLPPLAPTGK